MAERLRLTGRGSDFSAEVDLLSLVGAAPVRPIFYLEHPASGRAIAGAGAVVEVRTSGASRFADASAQVIAALASIDGRDRDAPVAVGGFAFPDDPIGAPEWRELPPLRLFVPRLLWLRDGKRCRLVETRPSDGNDGDALLDAILANAVSSPPPAALGTFEIAGEDEQRRWRRRVEGVSERIARGEVEKVVIARKRRLFLRSRTSVASLVAAIRATRPSCWTFWIGGKETSFLGSTPELLVRRNGLEVVSGALAGSAPRSREPGEDRALGERLLACAKNRHEHRLVVEAVRSAFVPITRELDVAEAPVLLRLPEAQHLYTPLRGVLREAHTALELAGLLHPTPAVCGVPRDRARRLIEEEEPDRGWYTGGIGWMAGNGDGEFAVALRSAVIDGTAVTVHAGAGIVAGSDPAAEFVETEAKLGALFGDLVGARRERAA